MKQLRNWYARHYFGFQGRIGRLRCFKLSMMLYLVLLPALLVVIVPLTTKNETAVTLAPLFTLPFTLLFMSGNISLLVRRFHDFGYSGWWIFAWALVGGFISGTADAFNDSSIEVLLRLAVLIWVFAPIFVPGDPTPNRFGLPNVIPTRLPDAQGAATARQP